HYFQLAALSYIPVATSILWDLLGVQHPTCICAPPPCAAAASASSQSISSATGVGSGQFIGRPYGGGPSYAGVGYGGGQPYGGGFPYRGRVKRDVTPRFAPWNESCSSETVGTIIEQSMTSSISESRELILRSLMNHYGRDVLVVCTPHELDFSYTSGAEFCSVTGDNLTCHGFVF
ncbi:hypothetical protein GCK32_006806, partial [Trichostrongylus colubriformis]